MFTIMGKYRGGEAEEIDTADSIEDRDYLLREYRMAFGADWSLWAISTRG